MGFIRRHKRLHIWLAGVTGSLLIFYILRQSKAAANGLVNYITTPIKRGLAVACSMIPISVAEIFIVLLMMTILFFLVCSIWKIIKYPDKWATTYRTLCGGLCIAFTIYSGLSWFYGMNYYADSFQEKSGIYATGSSTENLYKLTEYFAMKATESGEMVERDQDGLFTFDIEELIEQSVTAYDNLERDFDFLELNDVPIKKIILSKLMSCMNFTGFYFPFTGEANLNTDARTCMLPATILHEMAHQRNVASENESNFVAILACVTSEKSTFTYSGYLFGYRYLSNALYREDSSMWQDARDLLSDACISDLAYNDTYWNQYNTSISNVSSGIYDGFLKSYGEESGIRSYGEVVDLLIAYYLPLPEGRSPSQ